MSRSLPSDVPHPLASLLKIRRGEGKVLLLASGYFFFLLMGYYLLKPLREAMGIAEGADKLPWLITATLGVMSLANPAFTALVSHLPRRRFIPLTYRFFGINLLVFFLLFKLLPGHGGTALGYVFFVWLSVFNLFVVSVFWAFMADIFREEQGKRLFGIISVGGSLGAIAGSLLTGAMHEGEFFGFSENTRLVILILIAVALLEAAVQCMLALARHYQLSDQAGSPREPGPGVFEGLRLIVRSRLLVLICFYMLLFTLTSTFLYLEQGGIIAHNFSSQKEKTAAFATINLWTNILTLATQLLLTERLIRIFGLRLLLLLLPTLSIFSIGSLWIWPTFTVVAIVQVLCRGLHYAVDRPVREVLYIPLGPGEKYKSKPFIDTFVYRGGDLLGAWSKKLFALVNLPAGGVALAISAFWFYGALMLGAVYIRTCRLSKPEAGRREGPVSAFDIEPAENEP
jgi:ATP:ADP antiporter, AAA family